MSNEDPTKPRRVEVETDDAKFVGALMRIKPKVEATSDWIRLIDECGRMGLISLGKARVLLD